MALQFGDVAKCAELVFKVYQFGWMPENNAPARYLEFHQDVYGLHANLKQLHTVFLKVQSNTMGQIPGSSDFYDMQSVYAVLDQPLATIQECWDLLHDKRYFRNNGSHVDNIYWNVFVESSVAQLHKKIMFHNIKILALIKPLELKLFLDIRTLITQYGEAILTQLENQLRPAAPQEAVDCRQIAVPPYLCNMFEGAAKTAKPEVAFDERFPMHDGINAFLMLYKEDAENVIEQYVDMMKGIWIIQKILGSLQYNEAIQRNRLLKFFVEDLGRKCLIVFNRYSDKPANPYKLRNEPNEMALMPLSPEAFMIWQQEVEPDPIEIALQSINTIFHAPLKHERPQWRRELLLYKHEETTLEMMIKETSEAPARSQSRSTGIDLRIVRLNPVYADPLNEVNSISMVLYTLGGILGSNELLTFFKHQDLYNFQEAITGYRVLEDLLGVEVVVMEDKPTTYIARVQIWDYKGGAAPGTSASTNGSVRRDSLAPSAATRRPSDMMSGGRRASGAPPSPQPRGTQPPPSPGLTQAIPMARGGSGNSRGQKMMGGYSTSPDSYPTRSALSAGSHSSIYSRATQISSITAVNEKTDVGVVAFSFEVPQEPFAVLFLRPKGKAAPNTGSGYGYSGFNNYSNDTVSVMKIPIGTQSSRLETGNCNCRDPSSNSCNHSCIIGRQGNILRGAKPLFVQHYRDDQMVNLAQLGKWYTGMDDKGQKIEKEKINHVKFIFRRGTADKRKFEEKVKKYANVNEARWTMYEKAKLDVRRKPKEGMNGVGQGMTKYS